MTNIVSKFEMAETIVWYGLILIKFNFPKLGRRFSMDQKEKVKAEQACLFFAVFDGETKTVKIMFFFNVSFAWFPVYPKR